MPVNLFTHQELIGIADNNREVNTPILDLAFSSTPFITESSNVLIDKVAVRAQGTQPANPSGNFPILPHQGYKTLSVATTYFSEAKPILPNEQILTRQLGENPMVPMSPAGRVAKARIETIIELNNRYMRRSEEMAVQLLRTGNLNYTAQDGTKYLVEFERPSANQIVLSGPNVWTLAQSAVDPYVTIETAISGLNRTPIRNIIFGKSAWAAFSNSKKLETRKFYNSINGSPTNIPIEMPSGENNLLNVGRIPELGANVHVSFGGIDGVDGSGNKVFLPFIPAGSVLMIPDASNGKRIYGPIIDAAANYASIPRFMKNFMQGQPELEYISISSAPLLTHTAFDSIINITTGL